MRYIKLQVLIVVRSVLKSRRYAIGVDGGATKTVALIGTLNGKVIGRGQSGSSNYHNIGPDAARKSIVAAASEARKQAGTEDAKPDIAVVALAAINSPRDLGTAQRLVRNTKIARVSYVVHDSVAALRAANQGKPGIVVISGTGCVAAGINKKGRYVRVGGWGYIIDDEGSAYDIGTEALRSAFRALDGRAPRTKLTSALKRRFRVGRLEDASSSIYHDGLGIEGIAGLAPLVAKLAPTDTVCREILKSAGLTLAELAFAVAKQLEMTEDKSTITLVGGTFKTGRYLLRPFQARIREKCPRAQVKSMKFEPALGALSIAVSELQKQN